MSKSKTEQPKIWNKKKRPPLQYAPRREPADAGASHLTRRGEHSVSNGQWGAESKNPRTGKYVRTRHHTREQAKKRLDGCRNHTHKKIVDYQDMPAGVNRVTVSIPKKQKREEA